jgi:hypothetical protein
MNQTMTTRDLSLQALWFIVFITVSVFIHPALTYAVQTRQEYEIQQIDITADQIAFKRNSIRKEIRQQTLFAQKAEIWFSKLNQINAQIRKAKANKNEFASFNSNQISNTLHRLQNERTNILKLGGGINLNGHTFNSMQQLKNAYNNPTYKNQLEKEYRDLSQQLNQLEDKRNELSQNLTAKQQQDLNWNKTQLHILKEDLRDLTFIANNPTIWCIKGFWLNVDYPPYVTRKMAMEKITNLYLQEINTPPKKPFNRQELADRIKAVQNESNKTKEYIRNTVIPEKQQKLAALEQLIQEAETPGVDISGCWVIYISDHNYPVVNIRKNSNGYSGFITNVGILDYVRKGERLFAVQQINKTVFEGLEYSYDVRGKKTTTRLQLIADKNGNRIHYRGDDVLEMGRCQ